MKTLLLQLNNKLKPILMIRKFKQLVKVKMKYKVTNYKIMSHKNYNKIKLKIF